MRFLTLGLPFAAFIGSEDASNGAVAVGATEEVALEQEDGEVNETEDGPFETEGDVEAHSSWDGGIMTADGLPTPSREGSNEESFFSRAPSPV